jgi:hypothetical protein
VVLGLAVVAVAGVVALAGPWRQASPSTEPPRALVKSPLPGSAGKAVYGELNRSWFNWDTLAQTVRVTRRERQNAGAAWDEQLQDLSTAFYVTDVRARTASSVILELIVVGVYPNGDSCIERWGFSYPAVKQPIGGSSYLPISQRPLPVCRRVELLRTQAYGHIASVEVDPEARFLLFLTLESRTLHRVSVPTPTVSVEASVVQIPQLANAHTIHSREHATEGAQFHVLTSSRWEPDRDPARMTIVLHDADDDGFFESTSVLTQPDWTAHGYSAPGAWVRF